MDLVLSHELGTEDAVRAPDLVVSTDPSMRPPETRITALARRKTRSNVTER